jgi:chaperonin GroES
MTQLVPLEDHVLIEPYVEENISKSGIILPDNSKEKPSKWTVIAVGKGKLLENGQRAPMDVSVGDVVFFTKYSPDELEVKDGDVTKTYLVVKHSSILAVQRVG